MRISDWSSDVCSSDLPGLVLHDLERGAPLRLPGQPLPAPALLGGVRGQALGEQVGDGEASGLDHDRGLAAAEAVQEDSPVVGHAHGQLAATPGASGTACAPRSEEHTSELQSIMHSSSAVYCLKTKTT